MQLDVPLLAPTTSHYGHAGAAGHAAITPCGTRALTTSRDGTARVWDTLTPHAALVAKPGAGWTRGCALSADGRLAAVAAYGGVVGVWDVSTSVPRCVASVTRPGLAHATGASLTPDGSTLAATFYSADGLGSELVVSTLWRARPEGLLQLSTAAHRFAQANLREVALSADGSSAALTSWRGGRLWYAETVHARSGVPRSARHAVAGRFPAVALSRDGSVFAVADTETARIFALPERGVPPVKLAGYVSPRARYISVTPCGKRVVAAAADGAFGVWSGCTGVLLARLSVGCAPRGCSISACGTMVVGAAADAVVRVWRLDQFGDPVLAKEVSDGATLTWFRATTRLAGTASPEPSLSYVRACSALQAIFAASGYADKTDELSSERVEDLLEMLDPAATERITEPVFVAAKRCLAARLFPIEQSSLSPAWWEAFVRAADSTEGALTRRQAVRIVLKLAAKERNLVGEAPSCIERDRETLARLFAREDALDADLRGEQCVDGEVRLDIFMEAGALLMYGEHADVVLNGSPTSIFHPPSAASSPVSSRSCGEPTTWETQMCVFCQYPYEFGDTLVRMKCGHEFHQACMVDYLERLSPEDDALCPIDRDVLDVRKNTLCALPHRRYLDDA